MPGTELDAAVYLAFFASAPAEGDDEDVDAADVHQDAIITYLGMGAQATGTGALAVALPAASLQANDLLVLVVEDGNQSFSTPVGWTFAAQSAGGTVAGVDGTRHALYWKRATGSGDTGAAVVDTGDHTSARILAFRGVKTTGTPLVSRSTGSSTLVTTRNITALTGITERSMLLFTASKESGGGSITIVEGNDHRYSGFTDLGLIIDTTSGNDGALGLAMGRAKSSRNYSSASAIATRNDSGTLAVAAWEILAGPA